jgi:hypothetical protein
MKIARVLILCSMVVLLPTPALPDSLLPGALDTPQDIPSMLDPGWLAPYTLIDPQVKIRRNGRGWPVAAAPWEGTHFEFLAPKGSGEFSFYNANEESFRSLTFTIFPGGPALPGQMSFTCSTSSLIDTLPFSHCSFIELGSIDTATVVRFDGGLGLPPLSFFTVDLGGFPRHAYVSVDATFEQVPEPGTLMLCFSGLAALVARRRGRKRGA